MRAIVILIFLGSINLFAQESVNATGGSGTGSGGSFSYSVGQVVYTTKSSAFGTLNEGVQQSYEYVLSLDEDLMTDLVIDVFPNPSTDFINVNMNESDLVALNYELVDINGKSILTNGINSSMTQIDLSLYAPGSYFLKITDQEGRSKKFKIIKQ